MNVRRNYNFGDDELKSHINIIISFLDENLSDFELFGFNSVKLDSLKDDLDKFIELRTDRGVKNHNFGLTAEKNIIRNNLIGQMKMLKIRVTMKYGSDSQEFRNLELTNFYYKSDNELIYIARNLHSQLSLLLPEMSDVGLTPEILLNFNNLTDEFENSKNQRNNAANSRLETTQERVILGNKLFDTAKLIAHLAKLIYSKKNPGKAEFCQLPKVTPKKEKKADE